MSRFVPNRDIILPGIVAYFHFSARAYVIPIDGTCMRKMLMNGIEMKREDLKGRVCVPFSVSLEVW